MPKIITEDCGDIAILRLNNGITNAVNPDLLKDCSTALNEIKKSCKGMIFAGGTKFFSMGLDLPELLKMDRSRMTDFWYKFNQLVLDIFTLSLPTACIISGHAAAGGAILALSCDYRFADSEKIKIGLNEIKLGVPVPYLADMILRLTAGDRIASEMIYSGEFISVSDAETAGIIDEICSPEDMEKRAVEKLSGIAGFYGPAFASSKANRVEEIKIRDEKNFKLKNEEFLDCWFSEPVQVLLKEASHKF